MKFFSLIYEGSIHPADEEKVIPAEEFSTLISAKEIVDRAKEEAEKFKKETEEECKKIKKRANEEGFKEGLETFNLHIIAIDKQLQLLRQEVQKQILPLALKAAKKIVAEQLKLHPETIVDIVLQTLSSVIQNTQFTIYVNKQDKEILEANRGRIKEILESVRSLNIQERSDLSPGGCIIETEKGIINASIENQWRALESAFNKYTETK